MGKTGKQKTIPAPALVSSSGEHIQRLTVGQSPPRASLGRAVPRDAVTLVPWDILISGMSGSRGTEGRGEHLAPSPLHRLYLRVDAEGNDLETQKPSLSGGGTQQRMLSVRNNNLLLYI